ncbi:MAG: DUF342 domain-containing protein [Pseudomonadales bacterium]|nr:DUF342 domain-containing protein [Pseudomonadales bacterium]
MSSDINRENESAEVKVVLATSFPILTLSLEDQQLVASLRVSETPDFLTEEQLNIKLEKTEMTTLKFDKKAVSELLKHARMNEDFSVQIAEQIDASLTLKISNDKMMVTAEFQPACGGVPLDREKIQLVLDETKIFSDCVHRDAFETLLCTREKFSLLIASGQKAVNGDNTKFIPLIDSRGVPLPLDEEALKINYFDAEVYIAIDEGDPLMKRIPATDGVDGVNVLGKPLKAKKGKNAKFKREKGSAVDPENENLLVAIQKGHPIITHQSVKIDEALVLTSADLNSGNINFDGSVLISGHVFPQVKIEATGDIHVKGNVDNAMLLSGNDIVVGGGVVSESIPYSEDPPKITTILKAENDIRAMFINLTDAVAGHDIVVQKYVMHSHLDARNDILVGVGGGKGAIICGQSECGHLLTANVIGSHAYLKTTVICGALSTLLKDKHLNTHQQEQRKKELDRLSVIEGKLEQNKESFKLGQVLLDKTKKVSLTISALKEILELLGETEAQLNDWISAAKRAQIHVNKNLYPNTILIINDVSRKVSREWKKCVVLNKAGEVRIE